MHLVKTAQSSAFQNYTIPKDLFGTNLLITDQNFTSQDGVLRELIKTFGVSNLRYPGGSVTERYFDVSDPDKNYTSITMDETQGSKTLPLIPLTDFLENAALAGSTVTIVIPTIDGFDKSAAQALIDGTYGNRRVSADYLEKIKDFVINTIRQADKLGVEISAFELGNEFWYSGEMTALEYGKLASALSVTIQNAIKYVQGTSVNPDIVVQSLPAAGLFSPRNDQLVYVNAETEIVISEESFRGLDPASAQKYKPFIIYGLGGAGQQNSTIVNSLLSESITVYESNGTSFELDTSSVPNIIDGVSIHYYARHGIDLIENEDRFVFRQLSDWESKLISASPFSSIDYYVTEWNVKRDIITKDGPLLGLAQGGAMIEMVYQMAHNGVSFANFWPLSFNLSNNTTLTERGGSGTTVPGSVFAMMADSLPGLKPMQRVEASSQFITYTFGNDSKFDFFIVENSGISQSVSLSSVSSGSVSGSTFFVSIKILGDGESGGHNKDAPPTIQYFDGLTLSSSTFASYSFDIPAWNIAEIEVQVISRDADNNISGSESADTVKGGRKRDLVYGGEGDDRIYGYGGDDKLFGDEGDDLLRGMYGKDVLRGGEGDDRLAGGRGNDFISGGDNNDRIFGGLGNDNLYGNAGNDSLRGSNGDDSMYGGTGADKLFGGEGQDVLGGGIGDDILAGGEGDDQLTGGAGRDMFVFSNLEGNDTIKDFEAGVGGDILDMAKVDGISSWEDLLSRMSEKANGVLIEIGVGSTILLEGVTVADLVPDNGLFT